jgi:hypothetical protein
VTNDELRLLEIAKPDVVLQAEPRANYGALAPLKPDHNPHFGAAASLVSKGWLEFIEDGEFGQSRYRITPAGAEALQKSK